MEYRQLVQDERYVMARMMHQGYSYRAIAKVLDRSVSTISRERLRNLTHHDGHYRAEKAHQYAMARRRRTRKQDQYSQQEWEAVASLPKGMCMRHVTQTECDAIASELNNRPRRRLGFKTPSERFARS